jgi:hypothetical protein
MVFIIEHHSLVYILHQTWRVQGFVVKGDVKATPHLGGTDSFSEIREKVDGML